MSTQPTTTSTDLAGERDAPRGGGVAQILWYAHPETDPEVVGGAIADARAEVERSVDLLAHFVEANPDWFDLSKYREVHSQR